MIPGREDAEDGGNRRSEPGEVEKLKLHAPGKKLHSPMVAIVICNEATVNHGRYIFMHTV